MKLNGFSVENAFPYLNPIDNLSCLDDARNLKKKKKLVEVQNTPNLNHRELCPVGRPFLVPAFWPTPCFFLVF